MKILFALIFVAHSYPGYNGVYTTTSTRVGLYEKQAQCKQQGKALVDAMTGNEIKQGYFFCVPVNG